MFIYYTLFLGVVISSLTKHRLIQLLLITIMILFVGLRYEIGGDWYPYLFIYEQISNTTILYSIGYTDPGYGLLNYLASLITSDIWLVNLFCALLFYIGIDYIAKYSRDYWITFFIAFPYLMITVSMGYTRQSAAIGLIFIAFVSLMQSKKIAFLFFLFLAVLFHKSAILMIVFFPYAFNYNLTKTKNLLYIFTFVVILNFIMNRLDSQENLYFADSLNSAGVIVRMLIHLPAIVLYISYRNKFKLIFKESLTIFDTLLAFIIVFFMISFSYSTFADRFNLYFYIFDMIILSTFSAFLNRSNYYVYLTIIILFQFILFNVWLIYSPYAECCWIPYKNFIFID